MKSVVKVSRVIADITEVFHWIGAVLLAAATVCALAASEFVHYFVNITPKEEYGRGYILCHIFILRKVDLSVCCLL